MSIGLNEIKAPIRNELKEFDHFFYDTLKSKIPLLDTILKFMVKRKGKQIRPVFVLLSAALNGQINDKTYRGATLIELLHTATLIHDDVVDDSNVRRGVFTINALWKNKTAVLVGDYLLSRGMLLALANKDNEMLEIVSDAVRQMSEGELVQIEKARRLDISEDVYFEIIQMKTASLMATSCAIGAASSGVGKEQIDKMRKFGEYAGIAFQIRDDLLDYSGLESGKPLGVDLKEKKLTLPVIYALSKADVQQRKKIINLISSSADDKNKLLAVVDFINRFGGFEYARQKMDEYKDMSLEVLDEFPEGIFKTSLQKLIEYLIERNK